MGGAGADIAQFFGNFGLRKQPWFMDNAMRWILCNSDDSDDPNDFSEEDLLEYFGRK